MSVLSGNSNTNLSTILYGTNKTVQEVYFGSALIWSAQSTSFSYSPTTLYNLSNDGGSVDITFTPGVSDYVAGNWPAWVSSVTPTVVSGVTTKITVTYGANASTSTRDGNLTFFAGGENRTIPMSQQAADVTVTSSLSFVGTGGTQKIYITGSFSSWRISSAPLWVDYASSTGTTSPIDITADRNDTGSSRYDTISLIVDGSIYTIALTQAAIEVHLFKINPTPSNATVLIDGQQRTNNEAYFAPTTVIPWSVSASGYETQSGSLTMGYTDYTMDVTLVAATYTLSVEPTSLAFDYDDYGSSSGKSISITSNQSWTISVPTGFAISRSTSGSGNATFNVYPTSYNSGTTNNTGTLTITGNDSQYVHVQLTQKALILTIDPTELNVSASGGSYSVSVSDPNNYGWTISSNQSWCTVTPSSGTGNATIAVSIGTNTSTSSSRSATITLASSTGDIADLTCSVTQAAAQAITFDPTSVSFDGSGSEEIIAVSGTFSWWEITSAPTWCAYVMSSGEPNNPIVIEAAANTGSTTRTGTLVVEVDGVAYQIPLSQASESAVNYTFSISATPSDATVTVNGTQRTSYACPAGTSITWSVAKSGYITQSGTYTMGTADHTETVSLVAATLSVSLSGGSASSSITIPAFAYDADSYSEGASFYINSNQPWTLTKPSWCTIYGDTTSGSGTVILRVYPSSVNSGSSARTGTITVTGTYGGTATVNLTQNYDTDALQSISIDGPDTLDINDASAYMEVYTPSGTSQTGVTWSITSGSSYCAGTVEDVGGGGDSYVLRPTSNAYVGASITIQATSTVNSSIYATKTITVVDELGPAVEPIDSVTVSGSDTIYTTTNQATYTATVLPATAEDKSVTWSVTGPDASKLSINQNGVVTVKSTATYLGQANVVATSNADPTVSGSLTIMFRYR